jgi:hypothetical protein
MTTNGRPNGEGGADPKAAREAKLAAALRTNLRRRKAEPARPDGPREEAPKTQGGEST